MVSALLRRIVLCMLLAAIPVQGMAAAAMLYCCDRAGTGDATQAQDDSARHRHDAAERDQADEATHEAAHEAAHEAEYRAAHAGHDKAHDGNSLHAKCSVCAAFCAGGVIVSGSSGFTALVPCSSPRAAAPLIRFSSFFPDLAERPPLALL